MGAFYVNSFQPLVQTAEGREASVKHGLPPFIDGSIRREPDFEHPRPAITCLCRGGNFTPRLRVGDYVVYLTVKGGFGRGSRHRRLVAILEVERILDSHPIAAEWYRAQGMLLPNNLMVPGNKANPISHSHRGNDECKPAATRKSGCGGWDKGYQDRASKYPRVVACRPHYIETGWDARVIADADLQAVFGKVPGTRNPGKHDLELLSRLLAHLKIDVKIEDHHVPPGNVP